MSKYLTAPVPTKKMPGGIPYIIGNEAAERFSFYGMKAILTVFMTEYLLNGAGQPDHMTGEESKYWVHMFVAAVYFTPLIGAVLADVFFGKYMTILTLSIVYCAGHFVLALDETRFGLALGLGLITLGSGGIKPCVSAHVGDQFGKSNSHMLSKVFGWFYFSINLGSFASTLLTPWLLVTYGPGWAFGVPGIFMAIATICFWAGRNKFVHIPPKGKGFIDETFNKEGLKAIGKIIFLFIFIALFWSLFDQTASAWVLQAKEMDLTLWGETTILPSQIQAANPLMVMFLIPIFTFVIYPTVNKFVKVTPLRKMSAGMVMTVAAFSISALIQEWVDAGQTPSVYWQLLAYFVLTAAEVMVSITGLEFAYTQAPKASKSLVMSIWLLTVFAGNLFTALVNLFIMNEDGTTKLEGAAYYWFFTGAMGVGAFLFIIVAYFYKEKTYIQDEMPEEEQIIEEAVDHT